MKHIALATLLSATIFACGGTPKPAAEPEAAKTDTPATAEAAKEEPKKEDSKHPLIGQPAPAFSLARVNGKGTLNNASGKGKVMVVDFWATWCEPCKKSLPKLQELSVKYGSQAVFVGINVDDDKGVIAAFLTAHKIKFPVAWDGKEKAAADKFAPPTMPGSYVIDKAGVVRFVHIGYKDGEELEVESEIKSLL